MSGMTAEELGCLLDRYAGPLELYAAQWTPAAGDVVQEAFLRLFDQRPVPASPVGWLYRTVRHRAINASRSDRRRERHEYEAGAYRLRLAAATSAGSIDSRELNESLQALPPDEREVIVARIWGGLTFDEIAALTGSSTATSYRRFQSGLDALRTRLTPWTTHPTT